MSNSLKWHSTPHGHPYARQPGWTNVWMHHLARGLTYARRHVRHALRICTPTLTPLHMNMLTQLHERLHARTPSRLHLPPTPSPVTNSRGGGRRAGVEVGEEVARVSGRERWDLYGNRDGHIDRRGGGWGGRW